MQYLGRLAVTDDCREDRKVLYCLEVEGLETCALAVLLHWAHSGSWSGSTDVYQVVEAQQELKIQEAKLILTYLVEVLHMRSWDHHNEVKN